MGMSILIRWSYRSRQNGTAETSSPMGFAARRVALSFRYNTNDTIPNPIAEVCCQKWLRIIYLDLGLSSPESSANRLQKKGQRRRISRYRSPTRVAECRRGYFTCAGVHRLPPLTIIPGNGTWHSIPSDPGARPAPKWQPSPRQQLGVANTVSEHQFVDRSYIIFVLYIYEPVFRRGPGYRVLSREGQGRVFPRSTAPVVPSADLGHYFP